MTEKRPPACHYDRALGTRVTHGHRDDCPSNHDGTCPARGHGCAPCTARHCLVCGREHATNATPDTCTECIARVTDDLTDIQTHCTALAMEALDAGGDGRLVAAAPIPGGDAQVLIGPTVRLDLLRTSRTFTMDHRRGDPLPPLAVLAQWEDMYRAWLGHERGRRASVARAIRYLSDQVAYVANHDVAKGPDWVAFTRQIRDLRARLEHVLHDEREPEEGVECFECGGTLVRRFREVTRCRHRTPAREQLAVDLEQTARARDWLRVLGTYPELGSPRWDELRAAAAPARNLMAAARRACKACAQAQGGIDDPRPGRSWECPSCRHEYQPAEYATAVRLSVTGTGGWCTLTAASSAASDITGRTITPKVIRTWVEREDNIGVVCEWSTTVEDAGRVSKRFGRQLVFWPDVLQRAVEVRTRGRRVGAVAS